MSHRPHDRRHLEPLFLLTLLHILPSFASMFSLASVPFSFAFAAGLVRPGSLSSSSDEPALPLSVSHLLDVDYHVSSVEALRSCPFCSSSLRCTFLFLGPFLFSSLQPSLRFSLQILPFVPRCISATAEVPPSSSVSFLSLQRHFLQKSFSARELTTSCGRFLFKMPSNFSNMLEYAEIQSSPQVDHKPRAGTVTPHHLCYRKTFTHRASRNSGVSPPDVETNIDLDIWNSNSRGNFYPVRSISSARFFHKSRKSPD